MQTNKAYREGYNSADLLMKSILDPFGNYKSPDEIYLVPVVVHVIHLGEAIGTGTNISDAQINSSIDALNRDFRKLPDDGNIGQGAGVDTKIQFCLKGVNRVLGTSVSGYSTSGITSSNETSVKALSKWDNCCYINIWSVSEIDGNNGGAGVQGYAYFPTNPCGANASKDGVVVLYNAMGNDPGGSNGYNLKTYTQLGRVMTHEMGHVFNLHHTFSGGSCTETNCGTQGDECCDTPPHPGNNTNCSAPECGGTQPVNNYLDYTGEVCQNMFTQCQSDRMRAVCAGPRSGLFVPPCGCPPLLALDAGVININNPSSSSCGDTLCPDITIKNFGSDTLTTSTINYQIDGTIYNFTWTGSLAPNYTENISLPCVPTGPGAHSFISWTSSPNGGTDEDFSNDSTTTGYTTLMGSELTLTLTTDNFGYETYWDITDCSSTIFASGGNASIAPGGTQNSSPTSPNSLSSNTTYTENICLVDSCYCLNIYDDFGDGICCNNGNGNFLLVDQLGNTISSGGSFGVSQTGINFCVTSAVPNTNFSGIPNSICAGDSVAFTDLSSSNPSSWSWTFAGGTPGTSSLQNPTITYNTPGVYDVTLITSNNLGSDTQVNTGYVTVNNIPTLTTTQNNTNCSCNGNASATAGGGLAPYTYLWNDPLAQTSPTATGLCVGSYTVMVTDANGCTNNSLLSIIETGSFSSVIASSSDVTCNGAGDGAVSVSASNGNLPYTYLWNTGSSNPSISGLSGGTYNVTVTDAIGCITVSSINLLEPSNLSSSTSINSSGCSGSCTGSVTINTTGGTAPFTYQWDDPLFQTSSTAVGLCSGTYGITITDVNGCVITNNATITEASPTTLSITSGNATCGNPDGFASVGASGGNNPYTYYWNDSQNQTTATATGLNAGGYTITVIDVNGCSTSGNISVNASGGPTANITNSSNVSCNGICDGSATASQSGGTAPFTYSWTGNPGQQTQTATNLCNGSYQVAITDANGCISAANIIISEPSILNSSITNTIDAKCNSDCNGEAELNGTGGTAPYTYSWNTIPVQNTPTATGLCAGTYIGTITDANGCITLSSAVISEPPPLTATTNGFVSICNCPCAGVARVFPSGGTPPYNIIWSNGFTDQFQTKLCDGVYDVTITDANGCTTTGPTLTITN